MFCNLCGKQIMGDPFIRKTVRCDECLIKKSEDRFCAICGGKLPSSLKTRTIDGKNLQWRNVKYCDPCRETTQFKYGNPENRKRLSGEWLEKNGFKAQISSLARRFPALLTVIYECKCNDPNKDNHHFDYRFPFFVVRLCPACHLAESKRLSSIGRKEE